MLSYTEEARSTLLSAAGYYTDGKHNDSADFGLQKRVALFKDGKKAEFYAKLEFDLANQERFLLNNVNIMFQLHCSDDRFLIHAPALLMIILIKSKSTTCACSSKWWMFSHR
uniref:Uncharacterized protein n=1 Tax=Acrobeloides nanus TaxID=290746 RepID=A0A914CZ79_9BILA